MAKKYYWIKQRYNPHFGTYYVPCGNISIKDARRMGSALYGENVMLRYGTEKEYLDAILKLKNNGERVR